MATLQASGFLNSISNAPRICQKRTIMATLNIRKPMKANISLPNLPARGLVEEMDMGRSSACIFEEPANFFGDNRSSNSEALTMDKMYAILEAVADRVEMHKNIGEQRDSWNSLLLTSINAITLSAATMSGIAATSAVGAPIAALKLSSIMLYLAATGMLIIMNKIQPSQLVEEQRNAARFFQQLHNQIKMIIVMGTPTDSDVNEAMEKVLALDKAYPLPLLGVMLEKFPSTVEPAVWWRQQKQSEAKEPGQEKDSNGWHEKLEQEMREIVEVIRRKDKAEYLRLGGKALKLNKFFAISGPLLTGLAAIGSAFVGSPSNGSWAAILGVAAGVLASVVNSLEHGGQVGMVFEMYRANAGFFKLMEESIESNLTERRENGELLEMKVALQLGRSLSEVRDLASSSSQGQQIEEFGSKLF